jgi:subtilisin-like proprotein convertase family protein
MQKRLLFLIIWCYSATCYGQLVTFNGTGNLPVPPGAPAQTVGITQSLCNVTGVGILGGCATIEQVDINLNHTWCGDIGILLIGPGGQFIDLSTSNGGSGDNYTNTVFSDNAPDFVTSGAPPFTGTFRPEGRATTLNNPYSNALPLGTATFANTFNGTNADGNWTLYINDYVAADIGLLISWSITFNLNAAPPDANAGPDVTLCSGQTTTLSATGGGTYLWSNGATTATTNVSPTTTTTYTVTVTTPGCGTDTDQVLVTVSPGGTVNITGPANLCQGQNGALTATPGNLSSYQWSTGINGVSTPISQSGAYTVTATISPGCTATALFNVQELAFTPPSISGQTVLCPGGNVSLSADGSNYIAYNWSNSQNTQSITVSAPGNFTVTVTAQSGCTGTASISVTPSASTSTSIQGPNSVCPGGSVNLNATGSFISYDWSNSASGQNISITQPGSYTVTVTNNAGCTGSASINITPAPAPTVNLAVGNPNLCQGACVTLTASFTGTAPFLVSGDILSGNTIVGTFSQNFSTNTGPLTICAPAGVSPGSLIVQSTLVTDASCTCQ